MLNDNDPTREDSMRDDESKAPLGGVGKKPQTGAQSLVW